MIDLEELEAAFTPCIHLEQCQGCPRMSDSYSKQIASKRSYIQDILKDYLAHITVFPAEKLQFHRNKVDWWHDGEKHLGFRKKGDIRHTFKNEGCLLASKASQDVYKHIETFLSTQQLAPYNIYMHEGYLRYVIYRESKSLPQRVVGIITATTEHADVIRTLATQLMENNLVTGVCWLVNTKYSDTSEGDTQQQWGECTLKENMSELVFEYPFTTFFQTNPPMAEHAQKFVVSRVTPGKTILDLFCGVGTFSIPLAKQADYLFGIELSPEAIQAAKKNAQQLPTRNTTFIAADVAKQLQQLEVEKRKFEIVVADPPRAGLSKKIFRRVLRLFPKQLIYISCNPESLQRDLKWLGEYCDFEIKTAAIFDFFPHTDHVETIVDITLNEIKWNKVNAERKTPNLEKDE